MKKILSIAIIISLIGISIPNFINASTVFDQNYIISDQELTDFDSLSLIDIQNFLEAKNSVLAHQYFSDYLGKTKKASQIIFDSSREHIINPKFIITMLQKEQSLIENQKPSTHNYDWATGYGLCDSCRSIDPSLAVFKGFGKQVDFVGKIMRKYLMYPNEYGFKVGQSYEVGIYLVTPINQATANLYIYTPHIEGNRNFHKIWQDYWEQTYPDGSLLRDINTQNVWYIKHGIRKKIDSYSVLLSRFDINKVINVNSSALDQYPIGPEIKFSNYSLLNVPNGKVYLLVDDKLRHIANEEVFNTIGYNWAELIPVHPIDLKGLEIIEPITLSSVYPNGALLQDSQSGGIYYVQEGIKHPIYAREIWQSKYANRILTQVSIDELIKYEDGEPEKFNDGEIIKSDDEPTVYVISDGKRRVITTEVAFEKLGYNWSNLIITSQQAVDLHPLGELIE